jgi:hypothetical protein
MKESIDKIFLIVAVQRAIFAKYIMDIGSCDPLHVF